MLSGRRLVLSLALALSLVAIPSANAQSDVDIEKFTNGQDADTAPGVSLIVGATVNWTYVVTNTGSRPLTSISVTDDQGEVVTCPGTTLDAGFSFTCTASGTVVPGQYANIGTVTATQQDSSIATDSDPSHYFGELAPSVAIEKRTNGFDADTPPGPSVPAGSPVNWTYEISNIGSEDLIDIVVTDDQGVTVTCPGTTLTPGASMICTGSGIAQVGQYSNLGSVTATLFTSGFDVAASDASHYYGQVLSLVKRTNGVDSAAPPGPTVLPGSTVNWTYEVTNPGPATVTGLTVTDDQGVIVTCTQTTLTAGESVTCTGSGMAVGGQYTNIGTAEATLPSGGIVTGSDSSFYFANEVRIEKATNGVDADLPPGVSVNSGDPVNWTYEVTNFGAGTLTDVVVTDDQGVTVTCPGTTLAPGASMICTAAGVAVAGQYANVGTVSATSPSLGAISASDPSHYFGQTVSLDFGDSPDPTYQSLFASDGARHLLGSGVFLGACVDAEADALAGATADGDDLATGTSFGTCAVAGDDEDGVTFTTSLRIGLTANVEVVASAPCTLSAWIDFNADGDFGESEDDLFPGGTPLVAGNNALSFPVPAGAVAGQTYARFRCTTGGGVGFTGQAPDGEVEDYRVTIIVPVPSVTATKNDALFVDVDGDTFAEPGDTLRYTIVITNSGSGAASAVVFTDAPDGNTSLVSGSVTTSSGSVATGNGGGDTSVMVNVGTLAAAGGSATITFDVLIDDPLPPGVTSVANQGTVSGSNFANVPTDDPAVAGSADPTVTSLTVPPAVAASKSDSLVVDLDSDGLAEPGDTILYTIVMTNSGTGAATGIVFSDAPDSNTALVVGSVTTTSGSVMTGNTAGDVTVVVNIGTLAVSGGSATVTFRVVVDDPLPPGVTSVSNQGTVSGTNFADVPTDDPASGGSTDPTVTPLTVTPAVAATKTAALQVDADGDGLADPGDTLRYTIVITNSGSGAATGVMFNDTPDANTELIAGSVTTSSGVVTTGNGAGDVSVAVNAGTLAAGASVTIVFDVQIDNPFLSDVGQVVNRGTVSGSNIPAVQTDDPSQPGSSDSTVFAVGVAAAVPTLELWGLLAMLTMLTLLAIRRIG